MDKQSHLGRTILKLYLFDVKKKMGAEKNGAVPNVWLIFRLYHQ